MYVSGFRHVDGVPSNSCIADHSIRLELFATEFKRLRRASGQEQNADKWSVIQQLRDLHVY